jgi:hypothetical protein
MVVRRIIDNRAFAKQPEEEISIHPFVMVKWLEV